MADSAAPKPPSPSAVENLANRELVELAAYLVSDAIPGQLRGPARGLARTLTEDALARIEAPLDAFVVAVAGPNNAGKSSLFNMLVGSDQPLSPQAPTGGHTSALVAAARAEVLERGRAGLERRFRVHPVQAPAVDAASFAAVGDARELFVVAAETVPEGALLIDAPDCDGLATRHHEAASAAVAVADLVVGIVTPQTYRNLAVVRFLADASASGRPFVLVMNTGSGEQVAREQLGQLERDLGRPALEKFWAPYDADVQAGVAAPRALSLDEAERSLGDALRSFAQRAELREAAEAASRQSLLSRLDAFTEQWRDWAASRADLHDSLVRLMHGRASVAARALFPAGPFRDALQAQLDERSGFHSIVRVLPNQLSDATRGALRYAWQWFGAAPASDERDGFRRAELLQLAGEEGQVSSALAALWESAAAEVSARAGVVEEDVARRDFAPEREASLRKAVVDRYAKTPLPFDDFRQDCERSLAIELDRRGDAALQWLFTALRVVPPVAAVTVMALTGVAGDVGAGVAYVVTDPLLDRALGPDLIRRVRQAWCERRADALASLLLEALAPQTDAALRAARASFERAAPVLAEHRACLSESVGTGLGSLRAPV